VSGDLAAEFPGLRADWLICQCSDHSCDPGVGERLALLASRFNGRQALELRQQQVPAAYRSFFRQVGIDPEQQPTPIEQAVLGRLLSGGNLPQDRISDGLLLALLETSVPVVAFEAGVVAPPISIRGAEQGEFRSRAAVRTGSEE
jgi:DNA/RNA-binding domain of Phe-tRNA-synthetase-like protein